MTTLTITPVQPYAANKTYLCPGCGSTIAIGVGHLVVVPEEAPDLRRHWHHGCWHRADRSGRLAPYAH